MIASSAPNLTTTTIPKEYDGHTSIFLPTMATVVDVQPETKTEKIFTLRLPDGENLNHNPGQFVMLSIPGVGEAPFGVMTSPSRTGETFKLCIRNAGDLTSLIHQLKPGDQVGIRGPFGRGFPHDTFVGKDILVAPGGLALAAPALSLIDEILDHRTDYGRLIILYGARNPSELLLKDRLAEWEKRDDVELQVTVDHPDDEWTGNVGVITTLFEHIQINPYKTIAVTIGPPIMYRFVTMELLGKGLTPDQIWMSFERRMKCGVGKCGHCQVNHRYACQEGPSWTYAEALAFEEAL
ncbi:MAG: FAD/NAD(P)-binding protein [Anaerolineae bacterium]|nr:FAD/NAD(P)-binding protein [Anaerolineae bacterium]